MPRRPPTHQPCRQASDKLRGNSAERGYTWRWRKASKAFLAANPSCVECLQQHIATPATVVDHIVPHRGDDELFWQESNWQPLCKPHHDAKTRSGQ